MFHCGELCSISNIYKNSIPWITRELIYFEVNRQIKKRQTYDTTTNVAVTNCKKERSKPSGTTKALALNNTKSIDATHNLIIFVHSK
jgi:hypothetical protein